MKLIVCLGNVGKEYENTRHNIGFMVGVYLSNQYKKQNKFQALISENKIEDISYIIIKPITYMNNSGEAVKKIVDFYKIKISDILVIQDDMDLSFGSYKLKRNSRAGGHNGIKSIIQHLKTDEFLRLKIGIGRDVEKDTISYVLGKFTKNELKIINNSMELYKNIVESFVIEGIDKTFLNYNKK